MHIDSTIINLILASIGSFFAGIIFYWFLYRQKMLHVLQQRTQTLYLRHESERKILQAEVQNLENEQDLLRDQLTNKEFAYLRKVDELSKMNELRAIYATRAAQINDYKQELEKLSTDYKQLSEEQIKSKEKLTAAQVIIDNLEQSKKQLLIQFEHLGNKIFSHNTQQLKQANQQEISHLLNPFKEQFTEFKRKVEEIHELESRDRVSLSGQVKQLSTLNQQISKDTVNLTRALQGDVKFQGNWGEMVLENLLESSGLRKGLEYQIQPSFRGDDQHLLRPDVVINLPDNKTVIIDSKVSLKNFAQYIAAIDKKEQKTALKSHIKSLKNHIRVLSDKDYSAISELHSLDFVLLFVPIEQALILAINEEQELVFSAFQKRIILVSTTTLLATVRTIENFWRYDKQQSNAEEIAKQAGDMIDKFCLFIEELEVIGSHLDKAKNSYNTAHNRLFSGNGNLVSRAKVIQELGVKGKKEL